MKIILITFGLLFFASPFCCAKRQEPLSQADEIEWSKHSPLRSKKKVIKKGHLICKGCCTGPNGQQGPMGNIGPGGPAGSVGSDGPTGMSGSFAGPTGLIGPMGEPNSTVGPTGPLGPCCSPTGPSFPQAFGYFFHPPAVIPVIPPGGILVINQTSISTPNIVNNGDGTYTIMQSGCYRIEFGANCDFISPPTFYSIALATVLPGPVITEIPHTSFTSEIEQPLNFGGGFSTAFSSGSVIIPLSAGTIIGVMNNSPAVAIQPFLPFFNFSGGIDVAAYLIIKRVGDNPPP